MALRELDSGAFEPINIIFAPLIEDAKNYGESFDTLFEPISTPDSGWKFDTLHSENPDDPSKDIWIAPKITNGEQAA